MILDVLGLRIHFFTGGFGLVFSLFAVSQHVLVEHDGQEPKDPLVALEGHFPFPDQGRICLEFNQMIESG